MRWYKEIPFLIHHFGFRAMWNITLKPRLLRDYSRDEGILSFLEGVSKNKLDELHSVRILDLRMASEDCNIWVCWFQGEERMPETIKKCHESLHRNKGNHKVILISNDNITDYVALPDWIIRKHEQGVISNPHFSDIIRCYLLWKYGGIWIDAAVFVLNRIEVKKPFDTFKFWEDNSVNLKWGIQYMVADKDFCLFKFAYDYLVEYWRLYDKPVVYLLLDHVFELAYRNNRDIKEIIDEIPLNNEGFHWCRYHFNDKCDTRVYSELIENNQFLSLTWRLPYRLHDENGELTYYGRMLKDFDRPQ